MTLILDAGAKPPDRRRDATDDRRLRRNDAAAVADLFRRRHCRLGVRSAISIREEVIVRLGATTTPYFEATAAVGLATIENEDSDFWFGADSATVDIDPDGWHAVVARAHSDPRQSERVAPLLLHGQRPVRSDHGEDRRAHFVAPFLRRSDIRGAERRQSDVSHSGWANCFSSCSSGRLWFDCNSRRIRPDFLPCRC